MSLARETSRVALRGGNKIRMHACEFNANLDKAPFADGASGSPSRIVAERASWRVYIHAE